MGTWARHDKIDGYRGAAALLVLLAFGWRAWWRTIVAMAHGVATGRPGLTDFGSFWGSALALRAGQPLYAGGNLNHPALIVAMLPLTALAEADAYLLWSALNVACYAVAATVAIRECGWRGRRASLAAVAAATFPGLLSNLPFGQIGSPIALLLVAAWACLRRDRMLVAGICLGLAVALKPFLAPLLLALLVRRAWRVLAGVALGGGLLSLAALPRVGVRGYLDWLHILGGAGAYDSAQLVSIPGVLANLPDPPPSAALWATMAAILLGAAVFVALRARAGAGDLDGDLALLLCAIMLANPRGWHHYLVLILPLLPHVARRWPGYSRPRHGTILAALAMLWLPYAWLPVERYAPLATLGLLGLACALWPPRPSSRPRRVVAAITPGPSPSAPR